MTSRANDLRMSSLSEIADLRDAWRGLSAVACNPFSTWEWASTWWRHLGKGREQKILGFENRRGELVGIVPLYLHQRLPLRLLRFVGHFPADQMGPVCAPEHAADVARALHRGLTAESTWDLLLAERLPTEAGLDFPVRARRLRTEPMPELKIETTDWDEFLATKSSNFRGQVRNYERRLIRDHSLRFRLAADPDRLNDDMDLLFRLHESLWESQGSEGAFRGLKDFHRDFARQALENGWLRLWIAYLDAKPAAAWYGFRLGDTDWFYQGGRSPTHNRTSIGFVLMSHTVRDAVESGIATYKLLLGGEQYKARFSTHEPTVETLVFTRSFRGRLALEAAKALGPLPGPLGRAARQLRAV